VAVTQEVSAPKPKAKIVAISEEEDWSRILREDD